MTSHRGFHPTVPEYVDTPSKSPFNLDAETPNNPPDSLKRKAPPRIRSRFAVPPAQRAARTPASHRIASHRSRTATPIAPPLGRSSRTPTAHGAPLAPCSAPARRHTTMAHYVDRGCQTDIAGLVQDATPVPHALKNPHAPRLAVADTPTPPDDMALDTTHFAAPHPPAKPYHDAASMLPHVLLKRKARPPMVARISLPAADAGFETPLSPPPTEALMSPLPAANRLHAGHTPIIPRALSPLPPSSGPETPPGGDEALSGPLTLPPQPGDGAEDTIPLEVLDMELEKLRLEQEREKLGADDAEPGPEAVHEDDAAPLSRRASRETGRQKHSMDEVEVVDGVLLKKPRMNMGAPLGRA